MKTTRKLLVLFAIVALVIATLVVSTSAYVNNKASNSLYADLKNNADWVQIAGGSKTDNDSDGDCSEEGDLYGTGGVSRYYYNATTKTVSIEAWQTGLNLTAGAGDKNTTTHVAY